MADVNEQMEAEQSNQVNGTDQVAEWAKSQKEEMHEYAHTVFGVNLPIQNLVDSVAHTVKELAEKMGFDASPVLKLTDSISEKLDVSDMYMWRSEVEKGIDNYVGYVVHAMGDKINLDPYQEYKRFNDVSRDLFDDGKSRDAMVSSNILAAKKANAERHIKKSFNCSLDAYEQLQETRDNRAGVLQDLQQKQNAKVASWEPKDTRTEKASVPGVDMKRNNHPSR